MKINFLNYPICFTKPYRIIHSTWLFHIPFGMCIIDMIKPETIVELGTYYGASYCAFCQAIQQTGIVCKAYAVDTWLGDEQSRYYNDEVYDNLRVYHDPLYGGFSSLLKMTFDQASQTFPESSIDLLHIDGEHQYEKVKHDFETWIPKLSDKAIVLFHDTNERRETFDVWKLWQEESQDYPSFEFKFGHGLGVLGMGKNYPKVMNYLFNAGQEERDRINKLFFSLGSNVSLEYEKQYIHKETIYSYIKDIEKLNNEKNELSDKLSIQNLDYEKELHSIEEKYDIEIKKLKNEIINLEKKYKTIIKKNKTTFDAEIKNQNDVIKTKIFEHDLEKSMLEQKYNVTILNLEDEKNKFKVQLDEIYMSEAWNFMSKLQRVRMFFIPLDSKREVIFHKLLSVRRKIKKLGLKKAIEKIMVRINTKKTKRINEKVLQEQANKNFSVSIIIPVHNALEYTKKCFDAIYKNDSAIEFEVVLIDNASTDETWNWFNENRRGYKNSRGIKLEKNIGFGPAVNLGIQNTRSDKIVILNNDTIPGRGWIDALAMAFEKDPTLGIVSPLTNYVGEGSQLDFEAKNLLPLDTDVYVNRIADSERIIYEPSRLVFFCVMVRRVVVDQIGLLDEGYLRGNFEDDDYCLRARMAGFKLGVVCNAFVYHHGSATYNVNNIDYIQYFEENRCRFFLKAGRLATTIREPIFEINKTGYPGISVIVRTVNRPNTLELALASLSNQTYKDFDVILINDGGPDIDRLLTKFQKYFTINYFHNKISKGRTHALNIGLNATTALWISYLDDDDIYYPWHLETMHRATMKFQEYYFFYGNYNKILLDLNRLGEPIELKGAEPSEYSREKLLINNQFPINTWFHHRKIIEESGGFDESFDTLEDYEFLLRISKGNELFHVNRVISEYRYYLAQVNSICKQRKDTLIALQRIYEKNDSDDYYIKSERKHNLKALSHQVEEIEAINKKIDVVDEETKRNLYREILSIVKAI